MATYERLSGLDACFLGFETRNAYMHVAVTAVFDRGPWSTAVGGVDVVRLRAHVASRLAALPRFRQRLLHVPIVGDPVWVDDDRFDLAYHVRHASLPRPGSAAQLRERAAELLERTLNRQRPLWEVWAVEGLADGGFALVVKVHHCIVDGVAGIGMLAALLDVEPTTAPAAAPPWRPRPLPTSRELVRDEIARRARATVDIGRAVARAVAEPARSTAGVGAAAASVWRLLRTGLSPAADASFNVAIGPHRRLGWQVHDLARVRAIARRLGGTLNDVVLAAVSGALGGALRHRDDVVPRDGLRAVVPVSVRRAEEIGAPGNRVSLWLVPLPVAMRNARARFAAVRHATDELKRGGQAAGATVITEAANWAGGAVVEQAARWLGSAPLYNLIVTNVPGPAIPLWLGGSRLREVYPHLPLFERQGLGIALLSYAGRLHVGVAVDWSLGDFLDDVMARLDAALAELADVAGLDDDSPHAVASATSAPAAHALLPDPRRSLGFGA